MYTKSMQCDFINRKGQQCIKVARDGGPRCSTHKGRHSAKKCLYFEQCGGRTHGQVGLCYSCHRRMYYYRRKEMDKAAEEAYKAAELERSIAELLNTIA